MSQAFQADFVAKAKAVGGDGDKDKACASRGKPVDEDEESDLRAFGALIRSGSLDSIKDE